MNKFDQTFYSIKKVILEGASLSNNKHNFYIDFDMDTLNEKFTHGKVSFNDIVKKAKYYKVEIVKLDNSDREEPLDYSSCESFRIKSNDQQKIIKFLASFIDSTKLEEATAWILRDDQVSLDDDCMILDKSKLP